MTNTVEALKWKYPESECTAEDGKLTSWKHPSLAQPSAKEIRDLQAEYEVFLDDEAKKKAKEKAELPQKRAELLAKMGLSDDDFSLLARLILGN